MDENDLAALDRFVEAIKAACAGGRAVSKVTVCWESVGDFALPNLTIEFSDVPVGEAVGCGERQ